MPIHQLHCYSQMTPHHDPSKGVDCPARSHSSTAWLLSSDPSSRPINWGRLPRSVAALQVFFLAESDGAATTWALELAVRVASIQETFPLPTLGSFLWRRVHLRLEHRVTRAQRGGGTRLGARMCCSRRRCESVPFSVFLSFRDLCECLRT